MKLSFFLFAEFLIVILFIAAFSGCNSPTVSSPENRSFSPSLQKDLLHLHQLKTYRAGKNSFVLGLETICNRPPMLGEQGRKTILHLEGEGSLRHIWETHGPGKCPFVLEFFVDGEQRPSIQGSLDELVEAAKKCDQSFSSPGGSTIDFDSYNFYLPVPYEKSLRVDLVANPRIGMVFLQLDYRLDDDSMNGIKLVQNRDQQEDQLQLTYKSSTRELAANEITLPKTTTKRWNFTGDHTIHVEGPAIIRRLAVNSKRKGVTLQIRFDGEDSPAVNVDLADLFGPFRGVALNNNQCYFPYSEAFDNDLGRMRIHLENPYPFEESITINWGVTEGLSPRSVAFWYQDTPKDLTSNEEKARGAEWAVFGPVTINELLDDGNTPDLSDLDRLFEVLPDVKSLDAGKAVQVEHIIFNKVLRSSYQGWENQYASGPHLNLMYIYGHVMDQLGGSHHMGYYARAMMAKTIIPSEQKKQVKLQISYDDPLQVFLNGTLIYSDAEIHNGFISREIKAELEARENTLLVKILDTPNVNTMWAGISLQVLNN